MVSGKIFDGLQSRSRRARRESGFAGRALWMPRVTVATKWEERYFDVQPVLRHSVRTAAHDDSLQCQMDSTEVGKLAKIASQFFASFFFFSVLPTFFFATFWLPIFLPLFFFHLPTFVFG